MEFVHPIRKAAQIDGIIDFLKTEKKSLRDYCLFTLGITSGLRISDLLALTVGEVRSVSDDVVGAIEIREQKTGKTKDFPLNEMARTAIEEYLATRPDAASDEPLFLSRQGCKAISRVMAWNVINEAARHVGITEERIGCHTLRKTFGYWQHKRGADITRIQHMLNHSSPAVTLAYIGITKQEIDELYLSLKFED